MASVILQAARSPYFPAAVAVALALLVAVGCKRRPSSRPRVAVITGAAAGVGFATARECAAVGFDLVQMWDIDDATLAAARHALASAFPAVVFASHVIDVQQATSVSEAACKAVAAAPPGADWCVVSNAGIVRAHDAHAQPVEALEATFRVNAFAAWHLYSAFRAAFAVTPPAHASFVFVSSLLSLLGSATLSAYCASKAALTSLADSIRLELARDGLAHAYSVITILPYHIENTRMFAGAMKPRTCIHALREALMPRIRDTHVAAAAVHAARKQVHDVIFVPNVARWLWFGVGLLPLSARWMITGALGGWDGMATQDRHAAPPMQAASSDAASVSALLPSPLLVGASRSRGRRASVANKLIR